ncbi:hypothetical protein AURDEDRAFT_84291 [Auricularia subglabra TFB-10046 SS5]|nr:hypothetical protein AURDEDRAFT_84291 [Auricularia subglabra TFB-10046 SS5]
MASPNAVELLDLEPLPYRLGYGIPLIILSAVLCLAGSFLTLDRTRSFAPVSVGKRKTVIYRLGGGVGGLIIGWAFGLHLVTFLSLVISNKTSAAPIGVIQFLIVWAISGVVTAILAGRYRWVALLFVGIMGGAAFSMGLTVLIHPPLLPRKVFLAVFCPILTLATLIPSPHIHLPAVRFAAACLGAFGIAVGGAVLGGIGGWANIWSRLWLHQSIQWGSSAEHGLTAMFWILVALGTASNWFLRRQFGENPDQKWDAWLANYASSLPTRAGTFEPPQSFFQKWFKGSPSDPVAFPSDGHPPPFSSPQNRLRVNKRRATSGGTTAVKFQPLAQDLSSDSEEDELDKKYPLRPFAKRASTSGSSVTAVSERARGKLPRGPDDDVDYSDVEVPALKHRQSRDVPGWKPGFLSRAHTETGDAAAPPPPGAVPATPSLIKALERVQQAQTSAYGSAPQTPQPGSPKSDAGPDGPERWQGFWADVQTMANEAEGGAAPPKRKT